MIYERVKAECEKQNMSIYELEKLAGIGNGTIGRWAKGVTPNVAILQKVADVLKVSVTSLLKE